MPDNLYPDPTVSNASGYGFFNQPGASYNSTRGAIEFDDANYTDLVVTQGQLAADTFAAIPRYAIQVQVADFQVGSCSVEARIGNGPWVDLIINSDGWTSPVGFPIGVGPQGLQTRPVGAGSNPPPVCNLLITDINIYPYDYPF